MWEQSSSQWGEQMALLELTAWRMIIFVIRTMCLSGMNRLGMTVRERRVVVDATCGLAGKRKIDSLHNWALGKEERSWFLSSFIRVSVNIFIMFIAFSYVFSQCSSLIHCHQGTPTKPGKKSGNVGSITREIMDRKPDKDGNHYPTRVQCYITVTKTANSNHEWTNLILKKVIYTK